MTLVVFIDPTKYFEYIRHFRGDSHLLFIKEILFNKLSIKTFQRATPVDHAQTHQTFQ